MGGYGPMLSRVPVIFIENPSPSKISGNPVRVWVDPTNDHDQIVAEIKHLMAGRVPQGPDQEGFEGHASGGPGVIEVPPPRVASEDQELAASLARTFSVPEGKLDPDGNELTPSKCKVASADEMATEYHSVLVPSDVPEDLPKAKDKS